MEFAWHAGKRDATLKERGVDFALVARGFLDPHRRVVEDRRQDYGERRYNMLARIDGRIFHVTFTLRDWVTWIISARKANDREVRRYERG